MSTLSLCFRESAQANLNTAIMNPIDSTAMSWSPNDDTLRGHQELRKMSDTPSHQNVDRIPLKADGRIVFVPARSINWIESAGNYVEFVIRPQCERIVVRETLSSFERTLDSSRFVRIHRSVIVNVNRIKEMRPRYTGEYQLTMLCGKQLVLSRGYRKNLKRLLQTCATLPDPDSRKSELTYRQEQPLR